MTDHLPITFIILAAGRGSRMNSSVPKVMHKVGNKPLIGHILTTVKHFSSKTDICVVLSAHTPQIDDYCRQQVSDIKIAYQYQQLGTADAVRITENNVAVHKAGYVIIMAGDTPLVETSTLQKLIDKLDQGHDQIAAVVLAMRVKEVNTYGRLVINADRELEKIIEVKDANVAQHDIDLCNSGVIAVKSQYLFKFLNMIQPSAVTQELYLTDIIEIIRRHNLKISVIETDCLQVQGINTQQDLANVEATFQNKMRQQAMTNGVTLIDPQLVYFSHDTHIARGVTIHPNVIFGPGVQIDSGVEILSFSHIEGAHIKSQARIGPFARIRPKSIIDENAHVGNFVEIKNTHLGFASKAGHLTYLGDSIIGQHCNIGAGTITVNYDGVNKWPTHIKDYVFVGSNSSLIAPITIDEGALIAAGSTITKNVARGALAFGRARQVELAEGASKLRQKNLKHKTD